MTKLVCFLLAAILLQTGCSKACDTSAPDGLKVVVPGGGQAAGGGGAGGGSAVVECLASVTTKPESSDFGCYSQGDDCVCSGFGVSPGTVEVTVELDGETETQSVTIEEGECHVIPEELCFFGEC